MHKILILFLILTGLSYSQENNHRSFSLMAGVTRGIGHLAPHLGPSISIGAEYTQPYLFHTELLIQTFYHSWTLKGYTIHHLSGRGGFRHTFLPQLGLALDIGLEMNMLKGDLPSSYLLEDKESEYGWGVGWQLFRYTSPKGFLAGLHLRVSQIWTKPETSWTAGVYLSGGWAW